jgi:hypothetical protein
MDAAAGIKREIGESFRPKERTSDRSEAPRVLAGLHPPATSTHMAPEQLRSKPK